MGKPMTMPKVGDHVHYQPKHYKASGRYENGIVKEVRTLIIDACWVVYNCDGKWDRYQAYTSAKTQLVDLKPGWKHDRFE